jgi:capsular exopolysaccharide synthesis family protein
LELTRYLRVLRQHVWMIIVCPLVAALAAGAVSLALPPVYEAHVSLYVRPAQPIQGTDPTVAGLTTDAVLRTYADWMTRRPILDSVNTDLNLGTRPEDLAKKIKVTPQTNELILDVAVQDTNPSRARDIANQLVTDFIATVNKTQENQSSTAPSVDKLIVISPAVLPDRPVLPNKTLNVLIAFAAGLMAAIALAFLLDYVDQSIKTDDEVTERLGLVPIGHIAYVAADKGRQTELVALDGHSTSSEAFKALRTSVLFATVDDKVKSILITSPELGEGKSRTAANLAIALAQAGHKTLLIDADFRRPSQHRLFGRVRNIGLSNLILEDVSEQEALAPVDSVPNLWLLSSGPTPPNPSELLGSARMTEIMSKLWHQFEYVIVDTPPVNAVTDATIIASSASATVLIVEQGRTTWPALTHAKQTLDRVKANTIGVVVNKVRSSPGWYYYRYDDRDGSTLNESQPLEPDPRAANPTPASMNGPQTLEPDPRAANPTPASMNGPETLEPDPRSADSTPPSMNGPEIQASDPRSAGSTPASPRPGSGRKRGRTP